LRPISLQLNLNWIHSNLNIGWNSLIFKFIKFQSNLRIPINSSCMQCHSIFSFEWNLISTKAIHFFNQLIVTNSV
jgi:hypothetical protein